MKKSLFRKLIGTGMAASIFLAACGSAVPATVVETPAVPTAAATSAPTATAAPTDTPVPTVPATATTVPAATATQKATQTTSPAVTAAASSGIAQVIPIENPYCRKGPGYGYDAITFLLGGTTYDVIGRDSLNNWWQVQAPGDVSCWVANTSVNTQGSVEQVVVVQAAPLPGTPTQFVNSYVCDVSLKTLTVAINWAEVSYATGYTLYRNGNRLAQVGPTVTSFSDSAPLGSDLQYELEPYNDYGVAPRISTNVPACK